MSNSWPKDEPRYFPNNSDTLLCEPDPRAQLVKTLVAIVRQCPPTKPWTDTFKNKPVGLWTGPTSLAYLFFWISKKYDDGPLLIEGRNPAEWCEAYLDCGSEDITSAADLNGWGIKNEYLAYNAVKAAVTQDMKYVTKVAEGVANDFNCPATDNEHLSGRAGTLVLLRFVAKFVPESADLMKQNMKPLVDHILSAIPWKFGGHHYIGAAHGDIGIITQIMLSDPTYAHSPVVQKQLSELLDLQTPEGHWFITENPHLGSPDLVHHCHGSPGFVMSLIKIRDFFPDGMRQRIHIAIERGQRDVWEKGILRKEPNLCHGISGNMLAFTDWKQRDHFMAQTTVEKIEAGIKEGAFIEGDDKCGLLWGAGGRAWAWMIMDRREDMGYPAYTDV